VRVSKDKKLAADKAEFFSNVRLKLTVFRALALHTLKMEKARLAAVTRVSIVFTVKDRASLQIREKLFEKAPIAMHRRSSVLKKSIGKRRRQELTYWRSLLGPRQLSKVETFVGCVSIGKTKVNCASKKTFLLKRVQKIRLEQSRKLKKERNTKFKRRRAPFDVIRQEA